MDITNPNKIMFPDAALTKTDLVAHYERVAPLMLPMVADRPLTVADLEAEFDLAGDPPVEQVPGE